MSTMQMSPVMTFPPMSMPPMTPEQQATFSTWYAATRRDEVLGVLLALLLGSFGAHHFYLRRTGLGVLYLIFFWTGIPALLGFIEAFFMPGRVRLFNAEQAAMLAHSIVHGAMLPMTPQALAPRAMVACPQCHAAQAAEARFCTQCGWRLIA